MKGDWVEFLIFVAVFAVVGIVNLIKFAKKAKGGGGGIDLESVFTGNASKSKNKLTPVQKKEYEKWKTKQAVEEQQKQDFEIPEQAVEKPKITATAPPASSRPADASEFENAAPGDSGQCADFLRHYGRNAIVLHEILDKPKALRQ